MPPRKISWEEVFAREDIVGSQIASSEPGFVIRGVIGSFERLDNGFWRINFSDHTRLGTYFETSMWGWQPTGVKNLLVSDRENPAILAEERRVVFRVFDGTLRQPHTLLPREDRLNKPLFNTTVERIEGGVKLTVKVN